jgi:PAS domain S-box-containing protein
MGQDEAKRHSDTPAHVAPVAGGPLWSPVSYLQSLRLYADNCYVPKNTAKKRYDSYELEIILSLGFLILFLISLNFVSGYSFEQARREQAEQFRARLNVAADFARNLTEKEISRLEYSPTLIGDRLNGIAFLAGVRDIALTDTSGQIIACPSDFPGPPDIIVKRSLSFPGGRKYGFLLVSSPNPAGEELGRLANWDILFRMVGLASALVMAAYFLRAILIPYRRIKREALDYNLDLSEVGRKAGIEYIVNTFKDVIDELEEKKDRLESMYKSSEKRADSLARYNEYILGSITSGVVICDSGGIVTRFNPSAQAILQYLERDCRGRHYRDVFGNENKLVGLFDDALLQKTVHSRLEFEIKRPDGKKLWLGCSSSLINDERGEGMGAALLLIDLTEIRRLQEVSSYNEKMVILGETAAGLAHEVRNSFAAIMGFANLLRKSLGRDKQLSKLAEAIKSESMSAESLMSRFLSFARPLNINVEPLNIFELINAILDNFTHSNLNKIKLTRHVESAVPIVYGDRMLLRQAILNLVINACDVLSDGGEVRLRAGIDDKDTARKIYISVTDNGPGIDPDLAGKIFEPFISGKPDGTGLGLALVKKIIILHGGRIEVHSKPGRGTRFTIYLPITQDIENNASTASAVAVPAG